MSKNVDLVVAFYAALAAGNAPAALELLSDDIEWIGMAGWPYRTDSRGPAAVAEHILGPMMADWQDLRVSPLDYYDAGDVIISTGRYSGGYRHNSTSMVAAFAHIWTVGGGRLRRFRQFSDTLALYQAMQ